MRWFFFFKTNYTFITSHNLEYKQHVQWNLLCVIIFSFVQFQALTNDQNNDTGLEDGSVHSHGNRELGVYSPPRYLLNLSGDANMHWVTCCHSHILSVPKTVRLVPTQLQPCEQPRLTSKQHLLSGLTVSCADPPMHSDAQAESNLL